MNKLIKELKTYAKEWGAITRRELDEILSRLEAEQEEPLEDLIARKGVKFCVMTGNAAEMVVFNESYKARAYLMGLPDKGESK